MNNKPVEAVPAELTPPPEPTEPFLVVGVGASAGGLEAFKQLLESLPDDPGLALLFVQHLEPHRPSLLRDILSRSTTLEVLDAEPNLRLDANCVYVLPPDMFMAVHDGHLVLTSRGPQRAPNMPIDHLFRSLAEDQKTRAVGVILSGGGTDGTLGCQAIKAEGGITFVQTEQSAKQDSMPRSAVADGSVDYILSPGDIARQLAILARHSYPNHADAPFDGGDGNFDKILNLLRSNTDVDFSRYKRSTITRRVRRRMALRGVETFGEYWRTLQDNPPEVQNLYQDLLIRVTRFFRDEEVFAALRGHVLPGLVKDRAANMPIRVWVAGCSTGEEVYSLAICLLEYFGDQHANFPIKILATDLNETALEKARAGAYIDNIELDVSPERLRRFFAKVNNHYQISKVVRDLCVFSKHNLANDPPFSRLDLVSCRNLLIYLDPALQKRVVSVLHYALNPGGYLMLGTSESLGAFAELFTVVDPKHRIYAKNPGTISAMEVGGYVENAVGTGRRMAAVAAAVPWNPLDVQKEADRVLLARYAPVGVVIDENMTVLQFRGRTGPYLEPAPGLASLDVLKMLRDGLLAEVRAAVNKAKAENAAVRKDNIAIKENGDYRLVAVQVIPIKAPAGGRCFLLLFEDQARVPPSPESGPATSESVRKTAVEQRVAQLEQELAATREYLQSIVEEHESACEELKSASEEILSTNEELQSTNEELQTAKEETQSANEELATLNEELHHRNVDLAHLNNDLINLLGAVNLPIVLVSRELRIRRFTPTAEKALNLIPSDVGRPITDIKPNLNVPDLGDMITEVIDSLVPLETEVQDKGGRWYSLRIRPYITLENKIDGASITLLDIEALKRTLEKGKQ